MFKSIFGTHHELTAKFGSKWMALEWLFIPYRKLWKPSPSSKRQWLFLDPVSYLYQGLIQVNSLICSPVFLFFVIYFLCQDLGYIP